MKIHIVGGSGQMGTWLKNFFESQNLIVSVGGRSNPNIKALQGADVVFVSVPISVAPEIIKNTAEKMKKDAVLIDLSSVQTNTCQAIEQTKVDGCGLHFLFGPTVSSIQNQKVVLCRVKDNLRINKLKNILESAGAMVLEMTPEEHDLQMANIQNLTHFINLALSKTLLKNNISLSGQASTPPFLSQLSTLSRIITQSPQLLAEIQLGNTIGEKVIEEHLKEEQKLLGLIKNSNNKQLITWITSLQAQVESIPKPSQARQSKEDKQVLPRIKGKVGFLGPIGTFSHQASLLVAAEENLSACDSIYQIFEAVGSGRIDYGIVPAENSTEGTVRETLDYLIDRDLKTNGSIDLPVHQHLISREKNLEDIKEVISHPQALAQCRQWLRDNLATANLKTAPSTVSAMHLKDKGLGFIASAVAAKINNIPILRENIEDNQQNITKFYIVSKQINSPVSEPQKTLLFLTVFNRVGVLRDILNVFASMDINLSKIESRPSREKIWDYHFFIEVEVAQNDSRLSQVLNILKQYCPVIKILGGV